MQRPNEREFLQAVLREVEGLPEDLGERLIELASAPAEDRAEAIRKLFEERGRGERLQH
jgi:DNA helicase HerA-like ATPase